MSAIARTFVFEDGHTVPDPQESRVNRLVRHLHHYGVPTTEIPDHILKTGSIELVWLHLRTKAEIQE